jgi:hypothetical protein
MYFLNGVMFAIICAHDQLRYYRSCVQPSACDLKILDASYGILDQVSQYFVFLSIESGSSKKVDEDT